MRHTHLRAMIEHLRPEDTVKLVRTRVFTNHIHKIRKMSHLNDLFLSVINKYTYTIVSLAKVVTPKCWVLVNIMAYDVKTT